jgi:hypothetical protein
MENQFLLPWLIGKDIFPPLKPEFVHPADGLFRCPPPSGAAAGGFSQCLEVAAGGVK